jgi:hypothetical protein
MSVQACPRAANPSNGRERVGRMFVPALVASDLDGTLLRSDQSVSE